MPQRPLKYCLGVTALAAGYFVTAKIGLLFALPPGNATAAWPPSGIALATLLLAGSRYWPGVWIGAAFASATTKVSLPTAALFATGNTLEALLAVWLCQRLLDVRRPFGRMRNAFIWGGIAAMSSTIAATTGAGGLVLGGYVGHPEFATNWWTWWLGDVGGLTVVAPLLLAIAQERPVCWTRRRHPQCALLLVLLITVSQCVFGDWLPERLAQNLSYLPLILLFWVLLRFGIVEVTATILLFAIAAVWGTSRGTGPFATVAAQQSLFDLQVFLNVYAITGLALAGLVATGRETEQRRTLLAAAVESAGEAILISGADGTIQYVNPTFERLNGYKAADVIGVNPRVLKSGTNDPSLYRRMWEAISRGEIWRGSFQNRRKDGSLYHVHQTIAPVKDFTGNIVNHVSVARDITEQRALQRAQLALQANDVKLQIARDIQSRLFPHSIPTLQAFDCAGISHPAEETSGDYFDYFAFEDGSIGFVIGDVCGHGLGPALLMAETRAYLRALANTCSDVGEILTLLNSFIVADTSPGDFVTLFMGRLDLQRRSFIYAGAGHQSFLIDATGEVKSLDATALPLGTEAMMVVPPASAITLQPGDSILFLTDGILEAISSNGETFGIERAINVVRSHRYEPAERIVKAVYQAARRYSSPHPQVDDMTVMILKAELDPAPRNPAMAGAATAGSMTTGFGTAAHRS